MHIIARMTWVMSVVAVLWLAGAGTASADTPSAPLGTDSKTSVITAAVGGLAVGGVIVFWQSRRRRHHNDADDNRRE